GRCLHRSYPQGRKASRFASRAVNQVRANHQRPDRQDAWAHCAGQAARRRRRGDRVKLPRRRFLHLAAGLAALPALLRLAEAQASPTRPIKLVAPFPPGGSIDHTARLIGQWLTERLGQQLVIENRSGAAGNIGSEAALNSSSDGYTLLLCSVANAISATLYDKLNYNFRDVAPVSAITRAPIVLLVNPTFAPKTVPEFIAYAKANPDRINYASAGVGGSFHLSGELLKAMAGVRLVHVPYRGAAPGLTDLIGGQVQAMFVDTPPSIEHIKSGRVRA